MKPTRTSMLLRSLFRELGSKTRVDSNGFVTDESWTPSFPDPLRYSDAKKFALDYQIYNLARKREFTNPTSAQMRTSLGKWADSEWRCHVVNTTGWWVMPTDRAERARLSTLLRRTRAIISNILVDKWPDLAFQPTGGATATVSRKFSFPASKVDGTPLTDELQPHKCTPASQDYLEQMFIENPGVARRFMRARDKLLATTDTAEPIEMSYELDPSEVTDLCSWLCSNVPPATLDFVPKDMKSVRLIAKSNSLSIMVQKTFGDVIRKALKDEVGIDLNDQRINQEWAEIGSLTNLVATVDLSAASDSISLAVVNLFPRRWREYLLSCRDTHVAVKGNVHKLAMLAGMGNGYIFELESLLFYAMTRAVVEECGLDASMISVYGDDIICPVGAVNLLEEFFLSIGFLLNKEKSFSAGKFRESCGKHYFNGVDVTPWYVKSDLDNTPEIYHVYNGLAEWSDRIGYPLPRSLKEIANCLQLNERHLVPQTWSTKSGLHYPCEGILFPKRVWQKRYQRFEYIWQVLLQCTKTDVSEMLPERIRIVDRLIRAEASDDICKPEFFLRALSPLSRPYLVRRLHGSITEVKDAKIGWTLCNQRKKHRSESSCGDV